MSKKLAYWVVGLCTLCPGCCELGKTTCHNLANEKALKRDNRAEWRRDVELAESALAQFQSSHPGHALSEDFSDGFIVGFADYVYAGGTGNPPPLPPRRYWKVDHKSPQGYQNIEQWFEGYRHGSALARASGYREFSTVHSALVPGQLPPGLMMEPRVQPRPRLELAPAPKGPTTKTLPLPRGPEPMADPVQAPVRPVADNGVDLRTAPGPVPISMDKAMSDYLIAEALMAEARRRLAAAQETGAGPQMIEGRMDRSLGTATIVTPTQSMGPVLEGR